MRFGCASGSGASTWPGAGGRARWHAMHRATSRVALASAYRSGGGGGWDLRPALVGALAKAKACPACLRALTLVLAAFGVGLGVGGCVTYALVADGRLPLPSGARRAAAPAAAPSEVAAALAHPAAAHGLPSSSETLRVRLLRGAAASFVALRCAARQR